MQKGIGNQPLVRISLHKVVKLILNSYMYTENVCMA